MFHYCSGIFFIILFLWEHIFFLPFRFVSSPQFTFSLLPLLRSSAGSALFSPQEFYDSLTQSWDTKHLSSAGKDSGTGLTNRDTKPWRNEEESDSDRQEERERMCVRFCAANIFQRDDQAFLFCYLKSFPNLTGSVYLASRGHMVLKVPALPSSAPVWRDERQLTFLMVHSSSAASVQCLSDGGYAFLGPKTVQVTGVDGIVCPRSIRFRATTLQS